MGTEPEPQLQDALFENRMLGQLWSNPDQRVRTGHRLVLDAISRCQAIGDRAFLKVKRKFAMVAVPTERRQPAKSGPLLDCGTRISA
jgi:hypothetical protein